MNPRGRKTAAPPPDRDWLDASRPADASRPRESTGGGSGADLAAGKAAFTATCGGCHKLKDAGTSGNVGPDLDSLAPLTAERVAQQIEVGGGPMPPKLLTGADAANVAAYVASVAGK